uniref:Uncharacterized protein n=1 Tax=Peronospora matthiolae TaxID=2874970 RepID=A0AAV1T9X4_9STRA
MTRLKSSITLPGTKRDPMVMARHVEMLVPGLCVPSPPLSAWRMGPRSVSEPLAVATTTAAEANANAIGFMTACGQLSGC